MKILIYGAGVLGSLYAYRLIEGGHDVALLARGQRLDDLRQYGLELEDMLTGRRVRLPVKVVEQLGPQEAYDLVLVMMGRHQVASVLPSLAANHVTPDVLFMGNNATGPQEMTDALGPERVLLGFPVAGGTIKGHIVYYGADVGRIRARAVIGELDGAVTPRVERIAAAFESAGFETTISPNIDAWLKTHAAGILPLAGAYYAAGLDPYRLSRTRDALLLAVRSMREGLTVLRANGIPLLPPRNKIFLWVPEPLLVALLSRLLRLKLYQYALSHGASARPEMQHLAVDLLALARQASVPTPNLERLCALIDPAAPTLPDGSAQIPLDWRPIGMAMLALAGIVLSLAWLRYRRR